MGVDTSTESRPIAGAVTDRADQVSAGTSSSEARSVASAGPVAGFGALVRRSLPGGRNDTATARPPIPGAEPMRVAIGTMLAALCLLSVGGAVLLLLVWQQDRANGVLTTQVNRTWDLIDTLQVVERWVAYGLVPVAMGWIGLAAVNAGRATGVRRSPILAALSLPVCVAGVWWVGREYVAGSDEIIVRIGGWAAQVVLLAVVALFVDRIATAAEARHGPIRAAWFVAAGYLAQLQFLGGLSTIDRTEVDGRWGEFGAFLLIAALIQVVGALAVNEAERSIEVATEQRYELRSRFSESLLAQAASR